MLADYADFAIDIQPRAGDIFPLSVRSPGGETRGALRLPAYDPAYLRLADRLAALDTDEDLLAQVGQLLFKALFQGTVKEVYNRSQGTLKPGQGLRIKLLVAATECEVAALPWEYLNDPERGPLALLDAPVVRYLSLPTLVSPLKTQLPLNVLLTGAQIRPTSAVERELHAVESALARLGEHVRITLEPHLSIEKLQHHLRAGYDVWHFVGHGDFKADDATGQIYLEGQEGGKPIGATQLDKLLHGSQVRLVLLDTCDSAHLAADPLRSLAPALVRAGVPAVIAMQFKAPEETTRVFAKEFFLALAEGFPIDACVTEGRKAIMGASGLSRADWGIPVVYTRSPDGRLFDLPSTVAPTRAEKIVASPSHAGAAAAEVSVHDDAGTLLSAPPPVGEPIRITPAAPGRQLDFLNRTHEQRSMLALLKPGAGVWLSGAPGCGTSALLNQVAASAQQPSDGVLCVDGQREPSDRDDLLQQLFAHFYMPSVNMRVDPGTAQTYLSRLRALVVLDRLELGYRDLISLVRTALPNSAVLVAADGEAPSTLQDQSIAGLPQAEAMALCAAWARLDGTQPQVAAQLERICAALDNLPLPLQLAARLVRAKVAPIEQIAAVLEERTVREARLVGQAVGQPAGTPAPWATPADSDEGSDHDALAIAVQLSLEALSPPQRAVLEVVVTGRPDVHLAVITEHTLLRAPAARIALRRLADLGLVVGNGDRYEVSTFSLRRTLEDLLQPEQARRGIAAFYAANAPLYAADLSWLKHERGNILAAIETLQTAGQTAQAGALAKTIQPALVLNGLWGSWGKVIDWAGEAARQSHDLALEAWAHHERGTRAGLLGDRDTAARSLRQALRLRRQLGDQAGAAATSRNMAYLDLFPPIPPKSGWRQSLRQHPRTLGAVAGLAALSGIAAAVMALSSAAPTLADDQANTLEDQAVTIAVTNNDRAQRGVIERASLRVASPPGSGVASADTTAATISYTPNHNFFGTDRFAYRICDDRGECATADVVVTVSPVNDTPIAADDQASVDEDMPLTIDVTANDTDAEDQQLTVVLAGAASDAGGAISAKGGTITYAPPHDFNGADRFTYTAEDHDGGRAPASVVVSVRAVNDPPTFTKGPDQRVDEDVGPQAIEWAHTIAPGPPDEASQSLTFEVAGSNPELFTAQPAIDPGGKLTYTPAPDRFGDATVTVALRDDGGTADGGLNLSPPQTFAITVTPVNDQPVAADDLIQATEDTPLAISVATLLGNDSDRDGDGLAITAISAQSDRGGALSLSSDTITYTPTQNFNGDDTFTYTVGDGNGGVAQGRVTVAVAPVNDNPIAVDDPKATDEDVPLAIPGAELTGNDRDPDADTLTATAVSAQSDRGGAVTLAEGMVTYTPPAGYSGEDRFTYTVSDGSGSATGTVVVTVRHVNHPPVAVDDSAKDVEDQSLTIRAIDLTGNDSDRDKDTLTVTAVSAQSSKGGAVGLSGDTITYTPAQNFNGDDTFTYTVDDGNGGTAQATVTVAVAPVNDAPIANADSGSTDEGKPLTIPTKILLDNDSDVDGEPLTITNVDANSAQGGQVALSDGVVTYIPPRSIAKIRLPQPFVGVDSFSYEACDTGEPALCAKAVVTITVLDRTPPFINVTKSDLPNAFYGYDCNNQLNMSPVTVQATVNDSSAISSVALRYRYTDSTGRSSAWHTVTMQLSQGYFTGTIDNAQEALDELKGQEGVLEYAVDAVDAANNAASSSPNTLPIYNLGCIP